MGEPENLSGEARSLEELLRSSGRKLDKVLARFRVPLEDAEDLVQNVSLQYLRKRRQVQQPELWLLGALRNECRMYWRSRSRSRTTAVDESVLTLLAGSDGSDPEQVAMRRNLGRFIAALPWNCRSLLRMRYSLGLDAEEMAASSGYKPSSVDKVTRRCIQKLTRKLSAAAFFPKRARP